MTDQFGNAETVRLLSDAREWLKCITVPDADEKARWELDVLIIEIGTHLEGAHARSEPSEWEQGYKRGWQDVIHQGYPPGEDDA